ncbi:MAG: tRNA (adenosine(37)-N6)-threonylcarbamoyltransferase complex dimerization subunit type 1 TsaB [Gemmataceae bacterium]
MSGAWLILETSGRSRVGVAVGGAVAAAEDLPAGRQQNRHLLPTVERLIRHCGLTPRGLTHIAVGVGPGSYTGLRVGLTATKTLAYALGCSLVAVPTFAAIAADVPGTVDVIGDALQGTIYVQRFTDGQAVSDLRIERFDEWVTSAPLSPAGRGVGGEGVLSVAGPGLGVFGPKLPAEVARSSVVEPSVEAVFRVAQSLPPLTVEEMMRLEPLYLRGSSAEEKAKRG